MKQNTIMRLPRHLIVLLPGPHRRGVPQHTETSCFGKGSRRLDLHLLEAGRLEGFHGLPSDGGSV